MWKYIALAEKGIKSKNIVIVKMKFVFHNFWLYVDIQNWIKINIKEVKKNHKSEWQTTWQESCWVYFAQYALSDKGQQQMFGEEAGGEKHRIIPSLSRGKTGRSQRFVIQELPAVE